jgi:hypothetical protein
MFRLKDGRFIQIGQSWVKHGGNATNQPECGLVCQPSGSSSILGIGCCDAYTAMINGTQVVGPKSEVNPSTGFFPFPFCSVPDGGMTCPAAAPTIGRRLQVHSADIDTAANTQYFIQLHIIVPDDVNLALPRSDFNNTSYRALASTTMLNATPTWAGFTVDSEPAIRAWRANGLGPGVVDPEVHEYQVDVVGDGRFYFAGKATDLGAGLWQYEYAVQNDNSDRSGGSFAVSLPVGANPTALFFHDVDCHSGEPYSNVDWTTSATPTSIMWETEPHSVNPVANALRWDTLYNFGFRSSKPPKMGLVTLGLFKPLTVGGQPNAITALLPVPDHDCNNNQIGDSVDIQNGTSLDTNGDGVPDECQSPCPANIITKGASATMVDIDDLLAVISGWGVCADPVNCPPDIAPAAGDGVVGIDDLLAVISAWGACPPK